MDPVGCAFAWAAGLIDPGRVRDWLLRRISRPLVHEASFAMAWELAHEPWHWAPHLSLPLVFFTGLWFTVVFFWETE